MEEKPVVLRPSEPDQLVELPFVQFDSPIPLDNTRTSHEYHQNLVFQALKAPLANNSSKMGGFLFCVRDPGRLPSSFTLLTQSSYRQAYQGLRLLSLNNTVILDFDSLSSALDLANGLLLHEASLPAANYQLEWKSPQGMAVRIPIIVRPQLSTQLYVLVQNTGSEYAGLLPDLSNSAIAYTRSGYGFHADSLEMRLAERARFCLSRGANMIIDPYLDEMLGAKLENPMLGLLGAHLLLLEKEPRHEFIDVVLTNTGTLLGDDFPDVIALKLKLASMTQGHVTKGADNIIPVNFPPLLRRSWDYLLEASVTTPDLIPSDSFASSISRSIVTNGIWMAWRHQQAGVDICETNGITEALNKLEDRWVPVIAKTSKRSEFRNWVGGLTGKVTDYIRHYAATPILANTDNLLGTRDELKHVLEKVLDVYEIRKLANEASPQQERDLVERVRDLVVYLVTSVAWDEVITKVRRSEAGSQLSTSLSDIQKTLLPILQFARQHLEGGGELDRRFVEGMATSLAIPMSVFLDSLADLARQLALIVIGDKLESKSAELPSSNEFE